MNKKHGVAWEKCLLIIKDNIPTSSFKTWFEPIVPVKLENKVLTIQVPSAFFYEYLEEQFIDILRKTLRNVLGAEAKLEYNVVMGNNSDSAPFTVKYPTNNNSKIQNRPLSLPLRSDEKTSIKNPFIIPGIQKLHIEPQLKSDNTFENFIEGE
ncbi:Chromosomal replication initiator protein DnaA, partial [hydrothermal vent metagenome]